MSDQEKLEKRRQRRQQKIMAAAGDRLSRITGTAYRMFVQFPLSHQAFA